MILIGVVDIWMNWKMTDGWQRHSIGSKYCIKRRQHVCYIAVVVFIVVLSDSSQNTDMSKWKRSQSKCVFSLDTHTHTHVGEPYVSLCAWNQHKCQKATITTVLNTDSAAPQKNRPMCHAARCSNEKWRKKNFTPIFSTVPKCCVYSFASYFFQSHFRVQFITFLLWYCCFFCVVHCIKYTNIQLKIKTNKHYKICENAESKFKIERKREKRNTYWLEILFGCGRRAWFNRTKPHRNGFLSNFSLNYRYYKARERRVSGKKLKLLDFELKRKRVKHTKTYGTEEVTRKRKIEKTNKKSKQQNAY